MLSCSRRSCILAPHIGEAAWAQRWNFLPCTPSTKCGHGVLGLLTIIACLLATRSMLPPECTGQRLSISSKYSGNCMTHSVTETGPKSHHLDLSEPYHTCWGICTRVSVVMLSVVYRVIPKRQCYLQKKEFKRQCTYRLVTVQPSSQISWTKPKVIRLDHHSSVCQEPLTWLCIDCLV